MISPLEQQVLNAKEKAKDPGMEGITWATLDTIAAYYLRKEIDEETRDRLVSLLLEP